MEKEAIELFKQNYHNKGDCEGLEKYVKSFEKGYKNKPTTINYLPWAVAERIFRLQGGEIKVVDWKYSVDFDSTDQVMGEDGTFKEEKTVEKALFIHLKATWQGEELDEYYPIFDNQTSKVIQAPNAQDLNSSRQRGSVRLIARISGIGLWIFEQIDSQFEEEESKSTPLPEPKKVEDKPTHKKTKKVEEKKQTEEKIVEPKKVEEPIVEEDKELEDNNFNLMAQFFGETEEPAPTPTPKKVVEEEDFPDESEEKSELKLKIKKYVPTHREYIFNFIQSKGKQVLSDLSYKEMKELLEEIEG